MADELFAASHSVVTSGPSLRKQLPVHLRQHTRRMFRERMERGELRGCILPVAAIEQHLEHLAFEHDWRSVTEVATAVAQRMTPQVIVAEALLCGISEHHMRHPGTLTLRPGTFLSVLNDLIRSLVAAGFSTILVLNGHGGNVIPCRSVWDQFLREFQVNLQFMSYWDVLTLADAEQLLRGGHRLPDDLPGHAQEFETSFALARFPENVDPQAMSDQVDPSPQNASAEQGGEFFDRIVERLTQHLKRMIEGESVAGVPPFHP